MFKKPNFIQRLFINHYFKPHKSMVNLGLENGYYIIIHLYTYHYYMCVPNEFVDEQLKTLDELTCKWCVVNNVIFVW